jgi:hypothetical protein
VSKSILVACVLAVTAIALPAAAADFGAPIYDGYARAGTFDVYEIYDGQDPVYVRRYWREPFLGRHYFPAADERPVYGRVEKIPPANRKLPPVAEDYFRYWSTLPGYREDLQLMPNYDPKSDTPQK